MRDLSGCFPMDATRTCCGLSWGAGMGSNSPALKVRAVKCPKCRAKLRKLNQLGEDP